MIVKIRLNDDQYELFNDLATTSKQPISSLLRDSALLWVAFTTQPLIHVLDSDKYADIMNNIMAQYHKGIKP